MLHAAQLLFDLLLSHPVVLLHQTPDGQKDAVASCLQQNLQRHLQQTGAFKHVLLFLVFDVCEAGSSTQTNLAEPEGVIT